MVDTSRASALPALDGIGNISAGYHHRQKQITPAPGLPLPDAYLKWYDIFRAETPIPHDIRQLARDFLRREAAAGAMNIRGDLGFAILHRCDGDFYFLLVCTWRNENELWETVYAKDGAKSPDFQLFPLDGPHRGTFCVWELGAVWHEQQAWGRYLVSNKDENAKQTYLHDSYDGPV